MEDSKRKARLVAGGYVTYPPSTITYAIVVLRNTVRIALTLSALNEFPVKETGIHNAYITAPVTENICTVLGQEFGEYYGRKTKVVFVLYDFNSA